MFETETGVYLLVTFAVYIFFRGGLADNEPRGARIRDWLAPVPVFYAAAAAALLPLLYYASRGTMFTAAFWRGWMEAFSAFAGQGMSAMPVAELPDSPFVVFTFMTTLYLGVIAYATIRAWHRSLDPTTALLATVAAYGMALLLLFVSRSHPFNLCHSTAPLAVILTALLSRGQRELRRIGAYSALPWAVAAGIAALILFKPEFRHYPCCARSFFDGSPSSNPTAGHYPEELENLAAAVRSLKPGNQEVGMFDYHSTLLSYLSDTRPWSRYDSSFYMMLTWPRLENLEQELAEKPPPYAIIRGENYQRPAYWEFVRAPLYEIIKERYRLRQTVGSYEIWQLSDDRGAAK